MLGNFDILRTPILGKTDNGTGDYLYGTKVEASPSPNHPCQKLPWISITVQ